MTQRPEPAHPGDEPGGEGGGQSGPGKPGAAGPGHASRRDSARRARRLGRAGEVLDAGFTHRGGAGGLGFAAGGVLDTMAACGKLAVAADRAWARGLGALSDDELAGLLGAQRRLASRAAAGELAVIGELAARRAG